MQDIKNTIKNCSKVSSQIMDDIKSSLSNKKIKYEEISKYEILVKNRSKNTIKKIIYSMSGYEKDQIDILIQISEVDKNISIRQKSI